MSTFVAEGSEEATTRSTRSDVVAGAGQWYVSVKRSIDVVAAAALIVALAPLLVLITLLIVGGSGRPVFFRQERVGARPRRRDGELEWEPCTFRMIKFRTMVPGADRSPVHEQFVSAFVSGGESPGDYKLRHDPRVTRVGRLLRATSLDELPQLFNVLGGTMSLVGPRPVPLYEVAQYQPRHHGRLAARPGITGLWQVAGRGRVSFEEMVRMDIEYVNRHSLWLDLGLLLRTLPAVISRRGAA
jgi:lipopolysaccharide/colanic/teichoic acid biosynthesis glycosyltransferase